jgi:hypothetical protein
MHDCRFCSCVACNPWEEGVHNFRHVGRAEECGCDRCPQETPLYPDYPPGRALKWAAAGYPRIHGPTTPALGANAH